METEVRRTRPCANVATLLHLLCSISRNFSTAMRSRFLDCSIHRTGAPRHRTGSSGSVVLYGAVLFLSCTDCIVRRRPTMIVVNTYIQYPAGSAPPCPFGMERGAPLLLFPPLLLLLALDSVWPWRRLPIWKRLVGQGSTCRRHPMATARPGFVDCQPSTVQVLPGG